MKEKGGEAARNVLKPPIKIKKYIYKKTYILKLLLNPAN
jgi:hypothetical protein